MRGFLSTKAALMVYKGMILPIIEYGDIFLASASVENRKRLQILQNKGLRCALNKGMEAGSEELHSEANLLKLKYRREQHILTIRTRSQKKTLLKIKRPYTEKYKNSLSYKGPKKWNSLPIELHLTLKVLARAQERLWSQMEPNS